MVVKPQKLKITNMLLVLSILSFMGIVQAGRTQDPFYVIAHMANSGKSLDWAVSQGANAIENDLNFDNNGNPTIFQHGGICDCACDVGSDHICPGALGDSCSGPMCSEDAAAHLQHVAGLSGIALYFIDSKVDAAWTTRLAKAGSKVVPFLDSNLFRYGYKGNVVIGSGQINTYEYIRAAVIAANSSPNKNRYFFTFDQESDKYSDVTSLLSRLTNNRVYGTGISSCAASTYYDGIAAGVNGKKNGETGMTYIWTLDKETSMRKYIDLGVQGIMTNRVATARKLADELGLQIAKPSDPIPTSTRSLSAPNKCDCDYHPGGCSVSWPAPPGKACKCKYKGAWTCGGSLVSCNTQQAKCSDPDASLEACRLGGGDCDAYKSKRYLTMKRLWETDEFHF